ncbi:mitogen-activated protein kinase kinase kinase 3-like [Silene latifolia]|uniref:mitogen-activated protein kinase kinase kinase 3-like n=1 Tax=Silene latifolia TaxID=37657 RepID=UPI003D782D2D
MLAKMNMNGWFSKKTSKIKEETHVNTLYTENGSTNSKKNRSTIRSSEEGIPSPNLRRNGRDLGSSGSGCGGGSGGFAGLDSNVEKKAVAVTEGHPLPKPCGDHGLGLGHGSGSGSGVVVSGSASISSVGSSDSNSDDPVPPLDPPPCGYSSSRARSPGPGSRGTPGGTSPLHMRMTDMNTESLTRRQEGGGSQGHPLPLPPGSPSSPPSLPNGRAGLVIENAQNSLSKWKKGRLLGRGTFGHVYLGFNSEGGHMCAIKEVRIVSDDQNSRESLKQLNQEINLLSQLSHPNIVRYYGSELGGDTLSVYLEFVSGGSIHKLLQEYGPFKEPVIQNYTRQILAGLAYLHSRKTVHRDIKGANILVDPTGEIKLADFGMAKHITSCAAVLSFRGSPYWMAPEVVMNKNGYSLEVDIWSLGCTILEMAMAKPPWSQYEGVAAIFKIGNSKDIPVIPDFLSDNAKSFLNLCLQRDPSKRPSASYLLEHPFVKDQCAGKIVNVSTMNDTTPFSFDGFSNKPQPLEIQPRRKSISSYDMENMRRPGPTIWEARDNRRSITSLPVSPCSSPLRQLGATSKSCFLSPPHPSYAWPGQSSSYNSSNQSLSPTRRRPVGYTLDPLIESTLFKGQTPGGSPRMRLL